MAKDDDSFNPSWFLTILMLSVFWPVGLWFLWKKLSHTDAEGASEKSEKRRKRGLSGGSIALLICAAVFLMNSGGSNFGWFLGLGGCALFVLKQFFKKREDKRRRYLSVVGDRKAVSIASIASAMGVDEATAKRDLQDMVSDGWFKPGAYIDLGCGMYLASSAYAPKEDATVRRAKPAAAPQKPAAPSAKPQAAPAAPTPQESEYVTILRKIRAANVAIQNEKVSGQIDRIEQITGNIFEVVTLEPAKKEKMHTFMNYYLPTTLKLLNAYSRLEKQNVSGENIDSAKANIEHLLDQLVWAFERQNDQLFERDAMDISSDIKVMETMLAKDGLGEGALPRDPFGRRGGAAVQMKPK